MVSIPNAGQGKSADDIHTHHFPSNPFNSVWFWQNLDHHEFKSTAALTYQHCVTAKSAKTVIVQNQPSSSKFFALTIDSLSGVCIFLYPHFSLSYNLAPYLLLIFHHHFPSSSVLADQLQTCMLSQNSSPSCGCNNTKYPLIKWKNISLIPFVCVKYSFILKNSWGKYLMSC